MMHAIIIMLFHLHWFVCSSYQMDCRQYFHPIMTLTLKSIYFIQRNCQFIIFMNHKGVPLNIVNLLKNSSSQVVRHSRLTMLSIFILKVLAKDTESWVVIQYNIFTSFDWAEGEERSKNWKTTWLPWGKM